MTIQVLELVLRDYVHSWYDKLLPQFLANFNSEHEELFPNAVRSVVNHVCVGVASRLKVVDKMNPLVNFFTSQVVEQIKNHVGLYRQADQRVPRPVRAPVDKQGSHLVTWPYLIADELLCNQYFHKISELVNYLN